MPIIKYGLVVVLLLLFGTGHGVAYTYLLFGGHSGWIGQKLVAILQAEGHKVYCAQSRLENRNDIEAEIKRVRPDFIINAAGITGRPTIDWCETNKEETIRSNLLGIVNLVDVAFLEGVHVTNLATGCIYQYDEDHLVASGKGFTEEDEPNFIGSFYSKTKILAEKIILFYPHVLNLRIRMPLSYDLSPKSFVGKIIRYKTLINVPNSMTMLEDLLPLIPKMCESRLTGNYNFVNPGTVSHKEIIDLYKHYINADHEATYLSLEEQSTLLKVPRSNCELSSMKLLNLFPYITPLKESIERMFRKLSVL